MQCLLNSIRDYMAEPAIKYRLIKRKAYRARLGEIITLMELFQRQCLCL